MHDHRCGTTAWLPSQWSSGQLLPLTTIALRWLMAQMHVRYTCCYSMQQHTDTEEVSKWSIYVEPFTITFVITKHLYSLEHIHVSSGNATLHGQFWQGTGITQLCCKFTKLQVCQILLWSVKISQTYCKAKEPLFIQTQYITYHHFGLVCNCSVSVTM